MPVRKQPRVWRGPVFTVAVAMSLIVGVLIAGASPAASAPKTWKIVASPNPAGAVSLGLPGVACASAKSCFAVGFADNGTNPYQTLVEHWNGTSWKIVPSPNPNGPVYSVLYGVSCPAAKSCFAVGYDAPGPGNSILVLLMHWDGSSWKVMARSKPDAVSSYLQGVSCPSTHSCFAVGYSVTNVTKTLVERWDGHTWKTMHTPKPAGHNGMYFNGVSCSAVNSCDAVGYDDSIGSPKALAEHWNGASWKIVNTPSPTVGPNDGTVLSGVSCPAANNCVAAGSFIAAGYVFKSLVEHWNGHHWKIMPSPTPTDGAQLSGGVSCQTASNCFAGGFKYVGASSENMVEHWNGSSWTISTTHTPAGAQASYVDAVSCRATSNCFAVGIWIAGGGQKTLVQRYS